MDSLHRIVAASCLLAVVTVALLSRAAFSERPSARGRSHSGLETEATMGLALTENDPKLRQVAALQSWGGGVCFEVDFS